MHRTALSKHSIALLIAAIVLLAMPLIIGADPRLLHTLIMAGLAIVLATSNRLVHFAGLWHFGHIAFYATGAYSIMLLTTKAGIPYWPAFLLAGVIAGTLGLAFAYGTSRVKGFYFSILTLAFVEVIRLTIIHTPALGAFRAMRCPPPSPIIIPRLFSTEWATRVPYYYFILALVAIILGILYLIEKSRVGLALNAMAQSEPLARSIGINVTQSRAIIFSICAAFAGIAGAFYAPYAKVVGPSNFTIWATIVIWFQIVFGGVGSFWGPVIGAVSLVFLREFLPSTGAVENIYWAIAVLLVVFFLPGGLISLPKVIRKRVPMGNLALKLKGRLTEMVNTSLRRQRKN